MTLRETASAYISLHTVSYCTALHTRWFWSVSQPWVKEETHQEMRQRTRTFFTTTSYMYYKALRPPQTAQHGVVTVRTQKYQPEEKRQNVFNSPDRGVPLWQSPYFFYRKVRDGQVTKWNRNIAENFNRVSRAHERYIQTTDRRHRQTDGRTTYS